MRAFLRQTSFVISLAGLLSASLLVFPIQGQDQLKQRPRRVGETSEPSTNKNPPANGKSENSEEVDEGDVVRVDTKLVSVPTVITNNAGRPLVGLRRENFVVFEDGQPQSIANFGTTEAPFEIALLLDTSGSTRDDVALIREAANAFINALRPNDRVAVTAFNSERHGNDIVATVDVLSPLTGNRSALQKAISNLGSANGTPFYDGLDRVVRDVFRSLPDEEVRGRRAVVALTDGVDSASETDFGAVRARLLSAGIACYFIQVNTEDFVEDRLLKDCADDGRLSLSAKQLERYRRIFVPRAKAEDFSNFCQMGPFQRMQTSRQLYNLARREMNDLAQASGGQNFVAATLQDARAAFAQVANEIGTQYSLGYYPTNKNRDGKFRAIRVEVRGIKEKAQVRAREGYVAPKGE
ncbi:MAG: VWA domain-containing protein [Pyrinomonadaceae bacterium]